MNKLGSSIFCFALIVIISGCNARGIKGLGNIAEGSQLVIVSLGDSYASGEGNPDRVFGNNGPTWRLNPSHDARLCHRSRNNGHYLAAGDMEDHWKHSNDIKYQSFACGGATIGRGLLGPQFRGADCSGNERNCIQGQIDQAAAWKENRSNGVLGIDVVLISIGGNDLGFARAIQECVTPGFGGLSNCNRNTGLNVMINEGCDSPSSPVSDCPSAAIGFNNLPEAYDNMIDEVKRKLNPKHIILIGFPDPTGNSLGNFCNGWDEEFYVGPHIRTEDGLQYSQNLGPGSAFSMGPFSAVLQFGASTKQVVEEEFEWAFEQVLRPLNNTIENAATRNNVEFIGGLAEGSRTHGICAEVINAGYLEPDRWFLTFKDSWEVQRDFFGALHPNQLGHALYREKIKEKLIDILQLN